MNQYFGEDSSNHHKVLKNLRKHVQREYNSIFDKTISKNLEHGTFNYSIERVADSLNLSTVNLLKNTDI